jgi:hypothetical protein
MGARNRVGTGLSYRPARLHRLAESIPGLRKSLKNSGCGSIRRFTVDGVTEGVFDFCSMLDYWGVRGTLTTGKKNRNERWRWRWRR